MVLDLLAISDGLTVSYWMDAKRPGLNWTEKMA